MCCEGFKSETFGREDGRNEAAPPVQSPLGVDRSPLGVDIDNPEFVKEGKAQTYEKLPTTSANLQFLSGTKFVTTTIRNSANPTTSVPLGIQRVYGTIRNKVQPTYGTIRNKVQPTYGTIRNKVQPAAGSRGQPAVQSAAGYNLQPAGKYTQREQLFKAKYKQSRFQQRSRILGEVFFSGIACSCRSIGGCRILRK